MEKKLLIILLILLSISVKAQKPSVNIKADTIRANVIITSAIITSGIIPKLDSLPNINETIRSILTDRSGFYFHHRLEGNIGGLWIDNNIGTISYNVIVYSNEEFIYFVYHPYNNKIFWNGNVKLNKENMKVLRDLYNVFHP